MVADALGRKKCSERPCVGKNLTHKRNVRIQKHRRTAIRVINDEHEYDVKNYYHTFTGQIK